MAANRMRIDAHHHFWRYTPAEYGWIDEPMASIRRDFLPADLAWEMRGAQIDAVISVQARQSVEETDFLLDHAAAHPWIAGVVGWLPLIDPGIGALLDRYAANPRLRGLRHILQAEPDAYMERPDFNAGLALLRTHNLTYDILIFHPQLAAAIRLVDRHPEQIFVLDHIAKPAIREGTPEAGTMEPWATQMREMARRPNVFCKLSGVVTEADYAHWSYEQILPWMEAVLDAFTPQRMLFGSDWPVCRVATSYCGWVETVERFAAGLSADERDALFHRNAVRAYRLAEEDLP